MKAKKYRKKPVVIEAIQWTGDNLEAMKEFCSREVARSKHNPHNPANTHLFCGHRWHDHLVIHTLGGDHLACPGDFIIKGVQGEFYPCKSEIFWQTYEEVEEGERE